MNSLNIFAYGTLQDPDVLNELIGRVPEMKAAYIEGFIKFFDDDIGYYSAREDERSHVHGKVIFGLDDADLEKLDDYEGAPYNVYERLSAIATLSDGEAVEVQIYVKGPKRFT